MTYKEGDASGFISNSTLIESAGSGTFPAQTTPPQDPMVWAREKIFHRTTRANKVPMFYKESLRYIISKMGTLVSINSEDKVTDIKCVHANPERTIAKLKQDNNIILPIISINQNQSSNANERRRGSPQLVIESFWSDNKKRAVRVLSEAPRAIDIEYGINIWTKYKADMDQICEQIRLLFNPHMVVKSSYTTTAMAFIDTESDNSTLETSDRQERVLRRTFSIKLEGWIPNPKFIVTNTGEIEELNVESPIY